MRRITEEQAELSPNRMPMRSYIPNSNSNKINYYDKDRMWDDWYVDYNHHRIKVSWVFRYLCSSVGKSYNKVYSKFLQKIKNTRIYSKDPFKQDILDYFQNAFKKSYWFRGENVRFYIENGIIKKTADVNAWSKSLRRKKIKYADKKIYIEKELDPYTRNLFISFFGYPIYLQGITQGFTSTEFDSIFSIADIYGKGRKRYNFEQVIKKHWKETGDKRYSKCDYNMTPFKECFYELNYNPYPTKTKSEIKKEQAEAIDLKNKLSRERAKQKEEQIEYDLWKYCSLDNSAKKLRKIKNKEALKKEQEDNIITRDRLGFDDESFKTPQKFAKK